ncbi:DNA repair protein RadA [Candidatus Uhrbacteria bacterium]|nr:DNA repair protein RadA [Candidatus Uhrbacteria bacterium]
MFSCTKCDSQQPKWSGRCPTCQGWGTLVEEAGVSGKRALSHVAPAIFAPLTIEQGAAARQSSGMEEWDRVLGGGLVTGSAVLLFGEPGIGKSTLAAIVGNRMGTTEKPTLYASGEESAHQLATRLGRIDCGLSHFSFSSETDVEALCASINESRPRVVIVDSVQTLTSSAADLAEGGASLVRYATSLLVQTAKTTGACILLIGQVTKDGAAAGPKTLEHLVDVVLVLEGEAAMSSRILRASKNRFGSTDEVGVFDMQQGGLVEVANPSSYFLEERVAAAGSVITAALEGSRVFLVEVQALVSRLLMLCAILSRRAGLKLADKDVYVNVVGGLRLQEPAADLAVCLAIASALSDKPTAEKTVVFGEVGLSGEIRRVPGVDRRTKEAKRLGFDRAISPEHARILIDCLK